MRSEMESYVCHRGIVQHSLLRGGAVVFSLDGMSKSAASVCSVATEIGLVISLVFFKSIPLLSATVSIEYWKLGEVYQRLNCVQGTG